MFLDFLQFFCYNIKLSFDISAGLNKHIHTHRCTSISINNHKNTYFISILSGSITVFKETLESKKKGYKLFAELNTHMHTQIIWQKKKIMI